MVIVKLSLVALVFCAGVALSGKKPPSAKEFNLFCRILRVANDMMVEPDYVYDENTDRETLKEMEVLYNATTDNMNDFRRTLWDMKDFLKEHPPPIRLENRRKAHSEIKKLIIKAEREITENREIAVEVNKEKDAAKWLVLQGMYGDNVKDVPREEGAWTDMRNNSENIFVNNTSAAESCGNNSAAGKTIFNDFFCVCVGEGVEDTEGPCHPGIMAPKRALKNNKHCYEDANSDNCTKWTEMKHHSSSIPPIPLVQAIGKIEQRCRIEIGKEEKVKDIPNLLKEFIELIGVGEAKNGTDAENIFGHSGRIKGNGNNNVNQCTGAGITGNKGQPDYHNDRICVDYTKNLKEGKTYEIPWHNKLKEAFDKMQEAKKIEDKIFQNHADILLLKTKAWTAYSIEKDDETINLDDMNISSIFEGAQLPPLFPFIFLIP
ncbi:Variant surface glycoprotein [Trypanosoma congolense IL3000]|uniref:Variant surface glycoprotein n=1 Tax=Trypanosoma congolense (strain IL3000) TaxID=1068625 RepID=F9WDA8_TRYCI|nr:Variant surface glycoprotein [Trypanosoma congolense IL3000]